MVPAAGTLVTQNVRLVRLLGQGGMGSVWAADHLTLRTQVAVKFISEVHAHDPDVLHRFSREATSAAQIKSPHVVQVFDHGIFQGAPYIVMEMLEGEDLASRLERGPMALGELSTILHQVGKALTQAHSLGIIHRDIKPANVFLTPSGDDLHVKLLDFGIAKVTTGEPAYRTTQTGQLVGTPCYMSPEQVFSRGAVDQRVDLWALAVLAYEGVTGTLPFHGNTLGDIYLAINSGAHEPPSRVERVFPTALDGWFRRAFAKDPTARFGSAREMVDAFSAIAAAAPTSRRSSAGPGVAAASSVATTAVIGERPTLSGTVSSGGRTRARVRIAIVATAALTVTTLVAAIGVTRFRMSGAGSAGSAAGIAVAPTPTATFEPAAPSVSVVPAEPSTAPTIEPSVAPTVEPAASAVGAARPLTSATRAHPLSTAQPVPSAKAKKRDHGF